MGIDLYSVKLDWVTARSLYRKGENVYYLNKDGKAEIMMPYTYKNMWGICNSERARHAFMYEAQTIRKREGLNKLSYFKLIET